MSIKDLPGVSLDTPRKIFSERALDHQEQEMLRQGVLTRKI
ncbi:MAG: hypothetical protein AAGI90_06640 [Chlamydiota bacterium]